MPTATLVDVRSQNDKKKRIVVSESGRYRIWWPVSGFLKASLTETSMNRKAVRRC